MRDHLAGVWVLDQGDGVLLLTGEGWYSMQVAGGPCSAGHYGVEGERFLLDPVVAEPVDGIGQVQELHWVLDGDVLVLRSPAVHQRWHREDGEVVTGLGTD